MQANEVFKYNNLWCIKSVAQEKRRELKLASAHNNINYTKLLIYSFTTAHTLTHTPEPSS